MVLIDQRWVDEDGVLWTVRQIHRKDWKVALVGPGQRPRYVKFSELGRDYRLAEGS